MRASWGQILLLAGSVVILYGLWRYLGPVVYPRLSAHAEQAGLFLLTGAVLVVTGWLLRRSG